MELIGIDKRVQQLRGAARRLRMELEHPDAEHITGSDFCDLVGTLDVLRACVDLLDKGRPLSRGLREQLADQLACWSGYYTLAATGRER